MTEKLDLTIPSVSSLDNWEVTSLHLNRDTPAIKVSVRSNTGVIKNLRYVPSPDDPAVEAQIRIGLSFINQGKFMTIQGKSLQKWLLEKLRDDGHLNAGVVTGSPE